MRYVTGEHFAQVDNPDPFTPPVWRSPVHRTPEGVIWIVQLIRTVWRVAWFAVRHPLLSAATGLVVWLWLAKGWPDVTALTAIILAGLLVLRLIRPDWFTRFVTVPVRCRWRWWFYRYRWQAVMTITGLALSYRGPGDAARSRTRSGGAVHRPGERTAGIRSVLRRLRRPGGWSRARVQGACLPGPRQ